EGHVEIFRDPTSTVSIIEVPAHKDWIGHPLRALEDAVGSRTAYLMRFGIGTLPTASTVIQEGDQLFMLVTDDIATSVTEVAGAAPEGGH
ncbi:MAG TPA: TrkA C-terminal domain-containing protein, partial [Asanoa sp.]|nr:TrkA C-terminal domain-containing protein [Asanoa sp.]